MYVLYEKRNHKVRHEVCDELERRKERRRKKEVEAHKIQKKKSFSYNILSFTLYCLLNLTAGLHKFYIKNLFLYFTLDCFNTREQATAEN